VVFIIDPFGERETWHLALALLVWVMVVLTFGIFGAAVFAKPTVAEIEEVRSLVHCEISDRQISNVHPRSGIAEHPEQIRLHEQKFLTCPSVGC
jgi:hypothetical protein